MVIGNGNEIGTGTGTKTETETWWGVLCSTVVYAAAKWGVEVAVAVAVAAAQLVAEVGLAE